MSLHVEQTSVFTGFAYVWLLLRAFAAGCTALTGIEAISDGVAAFKKPEVKQCRQDDGLDGRDGDVALSSVSPFWPITSPIVPQEADDSVLSQMTHTVVNGHPRRRLVVLLGARFLR